MSAGHDADVVVVGGGVVGLSAAWRLAAVGLRVALVEPGGRRGASWVAAGMLAPVSEATFGEADLLQLNLVAAERFTGFADELEAVTGQRVGLRREGTLVVALDADDRAAVLRLSEFRRQLGLDTQDLTGRDVRAQEPLLAAGVRSGALAAGDYSVDARRVVAALDAAVRTAGVVVASQPAERVCVEAGRVVGVQGAGVTLRAPAVVVAAGAWSGQIPGMPAHLHHAVRPVKGQILRLRTPEPLRTCAGNVLHRTVRALVRGQEVYLVPRTDGELVVGASCEDAGWDRTVTAGVMFSLLRDAQEVLPIVSELVVEEAATGLRPGTRDNGPIVGATDVEGLVTAFGHYRNGVLLSALTADAVVAAVQGRPLAPVWAPFSPDRFR